MIVKRKLTLYLILLEIWFPMRMTQSVQSFMNQTKVPIAQHFHCITSLPRFKTTSKWINSTLSIVSLQLSSCYEWQFRNFSIWNFICFYCWNVFDSIDETKTSKMTELSISIIILYGVCFTFASNQGKQKFYYLY